MGSVSRPAHRRKHSVSSSLRNPYDDVLLSKDGDKTRSFGVHEYAEIFSGPSASIPELDLSGLNESGCRSSARIEYSSIFGGFNNNDVAVPYDEVVNDSGKKAKNRCPADARLHLQEFIGVEHQLNLSFNKTSQLNIDAQNGKTHTTQLHDVPGFTHFIDDNTLPLPFSRPSNPNDSMDPKHSRASSLGSKEYASGKINGEYSPSFLHEELDENSAAAASATALEKAIEQAQECMRIGKVRRERKREGLKVKDNKKETRIYEGNNTGVNDERYDPIFPTFTRVEFEEKQPESIKMVERVSITSEIMQGKIVNEEGEKMRFIQEDEMIEVRENCIDNKENCKKNFQEQLKINEETKVLPETGESESKVNGARTPEFNEKNHNHSHESQQNLPSETGRIEESYTQTFEFEASETISNNLVKVQKLAYFQDVDEMSYSLRSKCETVSAIDMDNNAELFHLGDSEMPETDNLHRSASEENFVRSEFDDDIEGLSSDVNIGNVGLIGAFDEEKLPKDDAEEYASKINNPTSPKLNSSDEKTVKFDFTYLRNVLKQTSKSDQESVSITSRENVKDDLDMTYNETNFLEKQGETQLHSEQKEIEKFTKMGRAEEKDAKENLHDLDKDDHEQRIEAMKKRREREKDRVVVQRVIREARERAFVEARERAERAVVERAAAEGRQRAMAKAREKIEKAKIRAESVAVERATAESRERVLEKAKSQNDKYQTENVSSSSQKNGAQDLDQLNGTNTESAQRRKAKMEREQRIMERASKALEEKNMRELVAQKEPNERNRLADFLDADIKRWASGKEGNLRALLSTLQYILGADSGWKSIPLTEIITNAGVKKAYRKATLCVHPDKLQQRGANIRQKYICEKIFFLLKAAWNRFNSEER